MGFGRKCLHFKTVTQKVCGCVKACGFIFFFRGCGFLNAVNKMRPKINFSETCWRNSLANGLQICHTQTYRLVFAINAVCISFLFHVKLYFTTKP